MFENLPTSALDAMDWRMERYQPYFQVLNEMTLTAENVSTWLKGWTQLGDLVMEVFARLAVAASQNTADAEAQQRYLSYVESMLPPLQMANNILQRKLVESGLQPEGFEVPLRHMRAELELFREANLPLFVEERKLATEYDKIIGAQSVTWDGKEMPLAQLQVVAQNPDRAVREQAWRLAHERYLADREALNALWVKFLDLRQQIAANAGFSNYLDYCWKALGRFDYTPHDCLSFHRAIEEVVVPAMVRLLEQQRCTLGVETLRPWDMNIDPTHPMQLSVDPQPRPALRPYQSIDELESRAETIFRNVDPTLGEYFAIMRREGLLDLANRPNKAPGGYCRTFPVAKRPFIFMNAVGLHDDVQTLLHEAGHAFHAFESAPLPYMQQREAPTEFAEVASMSMELLAAPYLEAERGGYYSAADAARARLEHLRNMITFWAYMAVVDAFQHWVYTNVETAKDPAACDAQWSALWDRFIQGVDWSGLDEFKKTGWHRKLHIFHYPFYYVEYGLAQLGAAQVWRGALSDQGAAVARYRKALALGGAAPLPQLYQTAGARFAFDAATLREAVALIERTIEELSDLY
ncbi:MAG: M3 family oligoendopeptidase [Anaerolineae bacterium]|nr:M3 family oligoendopeptidase [Anaerolineae bacterium]MDW8299888.1 M3 family oligoendopeptidase [Anaerolineae bacterium]